MKSGVIIKDVSNFSESYERGLRPGLVITEADKTKIENIQDFENIMSKKGKGDILMVKVISPAKDVRLIAIEIQ